MGVVLYYLLSGRSPFHCNGMQDEEEIKQKILKGSYNFNDPVWEGISEDGIFG